MGFETSKELYINIKDKAPQYDPTRHFYDQTKDVIQFYEEEYKKITQGVNIGGYHVHPWLYFHINYFMTPIPQRDNFGNPYEEMMNPPLDDNILYITESYQEAKEKDKILFLFGTRGFSKSVMITSLTNWTMVNQPNGKFSIMGSSDPDLKAISSLMESAFTNVHPAFYLPTLKKDWDSHVEFGFKEKNGFRSTHSEIFITNFKKGSIKESEKGAGGSPVGFVLDEALHEDSILYYENGEGKIKDVKVGDKIYGADGNLTTVLEVYPQGVVPLFEFTLTSGSKVKSCAKHFWKTDIGILRTSQIIELLKDRVPILIPQKKAIKGLTDLTNIESYKEVEHAPAICIKVDNDDNLFLTNNLIVTHNCGKSEFWNTMKSAIASFKTQYGWKLTPLISGTGGNTELSKDAKMLLTNPDAYDILPMNWDRLNRMVPEEFITWSKDTKKKFGTFVPGQMTYREKIPRIEKPLSDFLGIKDKYLEKIKVQTTNWEEGNKVLKNLIENPAIKEEDRNRDRMYYPRGIDDCFLTETRNPFPTAVIEKRIRELEESGRVGKPVTIHKEGDRYVYEFSEKKKAEVSHPGGVVDAPIMIFDELPEVRPEKYTFVSGLDDYKVEGGANTDSLGVLCVIKRAALELNEPCERVIATYSSRPDTHLEFHRNCELILETWNAECLIEGVDTGIIEYLDIKGKAFDYLAPVVTFSNNAEKNTKRATSRFGMWPSVANIEHRMNLVLDFTKTKHVYDVDDEGNQLFKTGVDYIDDIDLLREMMNYKKGGNFDRIVAFGQALVHARHLDKKGIRPKSLRTGFDILKKQNIDKPKKKPTINPYTFKGGLKRY